MCLAAAVFPDEGPAPGAATTPLALFWQGLLVAAAGTLAFLALRRACPAAQRAGQEGSDAEYHAVEELPSSQQ